MACPTLSSGWKDVRGYGGPGRGSFWGLYFKPSWKVFGSRKRKLPEGHHEPSRFSKSPAQEPALDECPLLLLIQEVGSLHSCMSLLLEQATEAALK
jgi:hypothetical protein